MKCPMLLGFVTVQVTSSFVSLAVESCKHSMADDIASLTNTRESSILKKDFPPLFSPKFGQCKLKLLTPAHSLP